MKGQALPSGAGGDFFAGAWPVIVGHRGNPARHRDNSLAGVMSGLATVGAVEVDVRLTGDGRLMLSHDPDFSGWSIAKHDASVLLGLDPRPCLLDEVLPSDGRLNLEVKNLPGEDGFDPDGRVALLVAARARPGDLVTSFYWPDMDLVRLRAPGVATGLVVGQGGSPVDAAQHAREVGHRAICVREELLVDTRHFPSGEESPAVVAWTVNSVERARKLFEMGVAAIISDDPLSIRDGLRE